MCPVIALWVPQYVFGCPARWRRHPSRRARALAPGARALAPGARDERVFLRRRPRAGASERAHARGGVVSVRECELDKINVRAIERESERERIEDG